MNLRANADKRLIDFGVKKINFIFVTLISTVIGHHFEFISSSCFCCVRFEYWLIKNLWVAAYRNIFRSFRKLKRFDSVTGWWLYTLSVRVTWCHYNEQIQIEHSNTQPIHPHAWNGMIQWTLCRSICVREMKMSDNHWTSNNSADIRR